MRFTPEFDLLLACCRAAYGPASELSHADARVDWPKFLRLARFHRVQGLAWRGLRSRDGMLPAPVAAELASDAADIAAANLRSASECQRLQQLFAEANVPVLFIKGLTLAVRVYGDAWGKAAVDVDVLIDLADLAGAARLLGDAGYLLIAPAQPGHLPRAHRWGKESSWVHRSSGVQIDLHTRLADNTQLIRGIGLQSRRQTVAISAEIRLPTLTDDCLTAYLAVHGASSAWFRLKWVSDFAAMLHRLHPGTLENVYERARALGTGRAIDQALLVADALFGSLEQAQCLKKRLLAERSNRWLARAALNMVTAPWPKEPTQVRLGTLPIHYTQLLLQDDLGFKVSELWRQGRAVFA